jgi:deoxyadenosine/deoxycytidine kinase
MSTMDNPAQEKRKKIIIFIQGNISSGKSTLIKNLQGLKYVVYEEPVDKWINEYKNSEGVNSLELFYQNMKTTAFYFEMLALFTRWRVIKEALQHEAPIVFIERCLETDPNSFALNLYENKLMDEHEWKLYNDLLKDKLEDVKHLFEGVEVRQLYLRTDPGVCYERKYIRNREEERAIPLTYFETIHEKHDKWLGTIEGGNTAEYTHIINGNRTIDEVLSDVRSFIANYL